METRRGDRLLVRHLLQLSLGKRRLLVGQVGQRERVPVEHLGEGRAGLELEALYRHALALPELPDEQVALAERKLQQVTHQQAVAMTRIQGL